MSITTTDYATLNYETFIGPIRETCGAESEFVHRRTQLNFSCDRYEGHETIEGTMHASTYADGSLEEWEEGDEA